MILLKHCLSDTFLLCTSTCLVAVSSESSPLTDDWQEYVPPWEVLMGSKCRKRVVVFHSVTGCPVLAEISAPSTSWLPGPSHVTVEGSSEVTVQVRENFPPAGRGLAAPEIPTTCVNSEVESYSEHCFPKPIYYT